MSTHAIGIDLGTSHFSVVVVHQGKIKIINNGQDEPRTPSFVAFTESEPLIWESAKNQPATNSKNTVFNVKRLIGRGFCDPKVQSDIKLSPFDITDEDNDPKIVVGTNGEEKCLDPEEISSKILAKAKEMAEAYLGKPVKDAVVGVPACFNRRQRKATKAACEEAGLNLLRIIDEPHAAAIAYSLEKKTNTKENVLIFDLGGGSLSLAIVELDCGTVEVKATGGDDHLGGEDFTNRLVENFVQEFREKHNMDISCSTNAIYRLRVACERAKLTLSTSNQAKIELNSLFKGIDFYSSISRSKFEEICTDLFNSTLNEVRKLLFDAKFDKGEVNEILMIGGSSRIPRIRKLLYKFFNRRRLDTSMIPDEAVASGAAILAAKLVGDKSEVSESVTLREFTPLSLGISVMGGTMDILIDRYAPIPTKCSRNFFFAYHGRTEIGSSLYQGERVISSKNDYLCKVSLSGLSPAPRGKTSVEVTLEIDKNGILHLSAVERGKVPLNENKVVITDYLGRFSRKEIEDRVRSAQIHRAFDEEDRKRAEAYKRLDYYCDDKKNAFEEGMFKEKYSAETLEELKKKVKETQKWLWGKPQVEAEEFVRKENELRRLFGEEVSEVRSSLALEQNTVSSTTGKSKLELNETELEREKASKFEREVKRAEKRQRIMRIMNDFESFYAKSKRELEELLDN